MARKVGLVLTLVALVVNFFQPVVSLAPHRDALWTPPWPMQVAQAGMQVAAVSNDEMERWILFAILGFLVERFVASSEILLDFLLGGDR